MFFIYYTDLRTGHSIMKQLIASFGEIFKKGYESLKIIIFQSRVIDLDKKNSKLENQENTICV